MDADELRDVMKWRGVSDGRDGPVVSFDETEWFKITDLRKNDQTYYLPYDEFENSPISFRVTRGNEIFQYFVLGERLHRKNGPAMIWLDKTNRMRVSKWYHNGLKHRDDGPAMIKCVGHGFQNTHPVSGENLNNDYIIEKWTRMECEWYDSGVRAKCPTPFVIVSEDGYYTYRTTSSPVIRQDYGGHPSLYSRYLEAHWEPAQTDQLQIYSLEADDYAQSYGNDEPNGQKCGRLAAVRWISSGGVKETPTDKLMSMRDDMFPRWNVWGKSLFPDAQERILAMSGVV